MSILKRFFKTTIKTVSGYKLEGIGHGSFALTKNNIDVHRFDPGILLLIEQGQDAVNQNRELDNYLLLARLKLILEKYQINLVLDVGANRGQFATELRRIGYRGKIISFEPVSRMFAELSQAAASDPDWAVRQLALGRQNTEQKIHISNTPVFSSLLKPNELSEQYFGDQSSVVQEEIVTIRRLDEVLRETVDHLDEARIYLKMDTQGYDLEVFSGLGTMSEHIVALQSELSATPIYEGMPHLIESIRFFEQAGFEIAGMYPVNTEKSTLQIIEFDCIMVNSQLKEAIGRA